MRCRRSRRTLAAGLPDVFLKYSKSSLVILFFLKKQLSISAFQQQKLGFVQLLVNYQPPHIHSRTRKSNQGSRTREVEPGHPLFKSRLVPDSDVARLSQLARAGAFGEIFDTPPGCPLRGHPGYSLGIGSGNTRAPQPNPTSPTTHLPTEAKPP